MGQFHLTRATEAWRDRLSATQDKRKARPKRGSCEVPILVSEREFAHAAQMLEFGLAVLEKLETLSATIGGHLFNGVFDRRIEIKARNGNGRP